MSLNYFVDINTSADSTLGNGSVQSCFNYDQFTQALSVNDETNTQNYYYLKGYRNVTVSGGSEIEHDFENIWMLSKKDIYIYSWGEEPWRINFAADFYLESYVDWFSSIHIKNGFIKYSNLHCKFSIDTTVSVYFENCWLDGAIDDSATIYSGGLLKFINCTLNNLTILNNNFNQLYFINSIIINPTSNNYYLITNGVFTNIYLDNVVSNRYLLNTSQPNQYNVLNPSIQYGLNSSYGISLSSNTQDNWDISNISAGVLVSAISGIDYSSINYNISDFDKITIKGNSLNDYNYTWNNGIRDGVGALYFPSMSGFAVSANSTSVLSAGSSFNFIISGNDPFTNFNATSLTYNWDDGNSNILYTNSAAVYHRFDNNGSYEVRATIISNNGWYSVNANSWTVTVGNFVVTIVMYDENGNNISYGSEIKPLKNITFSASIAGIVGLLSANSYNWVFGDNKIGSNRSQSINYSLEGIKQIRVSAFTNTLPIYSATDLSMVSIVSTVDEYYVYIDKNYDNIIGVGTEQNPLNWNQFKARVESTGEYGDIYYLQGNRSISANPSTGYALNCQKNKNFKIEDWDVSVYGPWVISVEDFSNSKNSIISTVGCTLKNGIIYNKPYQNNGGEFKIGSTYDTFVVYQGKNCIITLDSYNNVLSGSTNITTSQVNVSSVQNASSFAPTWAYLNSIHNINQSFFTYDGYIGEDFRCSAYGCSSGCFDPYFTSGVLSADKIFKIAGSVTYDGYNGCIMYGDVGGDIAYIASGDFDLEFDCIYSATNADKKIEMTIYDYNPLLRFTNDNGNLTFAYMGVLSASTLTSAASGHALKVKIVQNGYNVSAFYMHYTTTTRLSASQIIGGWNLLSAFVVPRYHDKITYNGGENGFGIGNLKLQGNRSGWAPLPYQISATTYTSANISTKPSWVTYTTFIGDDFSNSAMNNWWDDEFISSYQIMNVSGSPTAVMNLVENLESKRRLTRNYITGNFICDISYIFSGSTSTYPQGISIYNLSADLNKKDYERIQGSNFVLSGTTSASRIAQIDFSDPANLIDWFKGTSYDSSLTATGFSDNIILRLQQINNSISGFYSISGGNFVYVGSATNSSPNTTKVVINGNGKSKINYIRLQSDYGLPNNIRIDNVMVTSSSYARELVTSAYNHIIGSTIYTSSNDGKRSHYYFAYNGEPFYSNGSWNLQMIDSVFAGMNLNYFAILSSCDQEVYNCCFDSSASEISGSFYFTTAHSATFRNNQFNWIAPEDYPFTVNNDLYNKDIFYIINNKKKLRPFSGITVPPNPGKNSPTYPNYETGLFGYSRKDYIRPS